MSRLVKWFSVIGVLVFMLTACQSNAAQSPTPTPTGEPAEQETAAAGPEKIHQPPVEPIIVREGNTVKIEMTAQVTDIEIAKGVTYNAWTFNGTVPGPVVRVKQGDILEFTMKNMDPYVPHSMDFHAVHAAPSEKFIDVMPNEEGTFVYPANMPGVFMYHCGTAPVLEHIANGMYGMIIVEPTEGYPTDQDIDHEFMIVQSEWYAEKDFNAMLNEEPDYVVFNGDTFTLHEQPFEAKAGDQIRMYVVNARPNEVSSFHVVGTIFDRVNADGNPANVLLGIQTVLVPAGGGTVVEFTVTEPGDYHIVTHQFNHATKGATATLRVTE